MARYLIVIFFLISVGHGCDLVSTSSSIHLSCPKGVPKNTVYYKSSPERMVIAFSKPLHLEKSFLNDKKLVLKNIKGKDYLVNYDLTKTNIKKDKKHLIFHNQKAVQSCQWHKKQHKPFTVVIDPGHGGHDPGITYSNLKEKDIALQFSKLLALELHKKSIPIVTKLTRNKDQFIPLADRPWFAIKHHADLFLSIHVDGSDNQTARGLSIFTLAERGATSKVALRLARKENTVFSRPTSNIIENFERDIGYYQSHKIGNSLIDRLKQSVSLHTNQLESANFIVLKSLKIPSCLIELGFISNEKDRQLFKKPLYQKFLAAEISSEIANYFEHNRFQYFYDCHLKPPRLSVTVKKGDTLSKISREHHLSVEQLMRMNLLTSSNLQIGQSVYIK
ncbi:MAG: hypothetical protein CMF41_05680 [Legionellales bacterium]|nr:hypothetical protein [Legionellales bacterium]OUX64403.1 MAG: hypothetical protein CBE41_03295 [Gammaproteobacteria bacterium TMED281]